LSLQQPPAVPSLTKRLNLFPSSAANDIQTPPLSLRFWIVFLGCTLLVHNLISPLFAFSLRISIHINPKIKMSVNRPLPPLEPLSHFAFPHKTFRKRVSPFQICANRLSAPWLVTDSTSWSSTGFSPPPDSIIHSGRPRSMLPFLVSISYA